MILENWCVGVALHKIIRRGGRTTTKRSTWVWENLLGVAKIRSFMSWTDAARSFTWQSNETSSQSFLAFEHPTKMCQTFSINPYKRNTKWEDNHEQPSIRTQSFFARFSNSIDSSNFHLHEDGNYQSYYPWHDSKLI